MGNIDQSDLLLFVAASLIAVTVLVRLMRARRDQVLGQLRDQMDREKQKRMAEERRQRVAAKKAERKAS